MAENPKFIELLRRIHDSTLKGSLRWEPAMDKDAYSLDLGKAVLTLGYSVGYGPTTYYAMLEDHSGKPLERLWESETDSHFEFLRDVYELARRKALNVDALLDDLIKNVKV
jgi:hypothetical protein